MGCPRPNTPRSDPRAIGELAEPLRSRVWTVVQDAPTGGLMLNSGYRDPGRQWDLRHDRVPHGQECNSAFSGFPVTAVPAQFIDGRWVGGSHHQHRTAADMAGRELLWLIEHRFEYGLGLTVLSENWHFETEGIDKRTGRRIPAPTRRIIPWPGSGPAPSEEDDDMPLNDADKAWIKRTVDDSVNRAIGGVMTDEASDAKADEAEIIRDGSLKGWVVAMAKKAGVTRADAIREDPTHRKD